MLNINIGVFSFLLFNAGIYVWDVSFAYIEVLTTTVKKNKNKNVLQVLDLF